MSSTSQRTLLIVDDERDLVEVLCDEFTPMGVRCLTAYSGKEALAAIQAHNPDAILSDINMPGMTGLEMLAKLREQGCETPLIFLTAYGDKEKVTQALRMGANDFHEKPYDAKPLRASVTKALELGASLKSLDQELDQICEGMAPDKLVQFREIKRKLVINRKQREVYFKKAN